ncbi:hypothetical protein P2O74_13175 [Escherichia coli]
MHEKNIALLCDEADRLLQLNINLLRQMVDDGRNTAEEYALMPFP